MISPLQFELYFLDISLQANTLLSSTVRKQNVVETHDEAIPFVNDNRGLVLNNASLDEVSNSEINVDVAKKCSAGVVTIYRAIGAKFDSNLQLLCRTQSLTEKIRFFSYNDNFNALEQNINEPE